MTDRVAEVGRQAGEGGGRSHVAFLGDLQRIQCFEHYPTQAARCSRYQ